jgi:CRISPR-associated protein Cmr5
MKIRTHKYAELAYPLVDAIQGDAIEAKYRTLALTFPSMIMQSGLAQAIGFLMAKNKDEHKVLLGHIAILLNKNDASALHQAILKSSVTEYQLLSREALDASAWLKRYTQALLEKQS